MRRHHSLLLLAWLCYLVAWFVPVIKDGITLPQGMPGWQAFCFAATAILPGKHTGFEHWWLRPLTGFSAISNVVFLLSLMAIILKKHGLVLTSAWIAVITYALNSHWFILFGHERSDLKIGYYLWWGSFAILAFALFDIARSYSQQCSDKQTAKAAGTQ